MIFMALAQEKLYTTDDIYALPDGTRAELIDGEMYMMAPPENFKHQKTFGFLALWTIGSLYPVVRHGELRSFGRLRLLYF